MLHVPASSADGHAVAEALREMGLGGLVLDLTEDPAWRRHVAEEIKEGLGAQPPELDVPAIVDLRERLRSAICPADSIILQQGARLPTTPSVFFI